MKEGAFMISIPGYGLRLKKVINKKEHEQTKQLVVGICVVPVLERENLITILHSVYSNVRCVDFTTLMTVHPENLDILIVSDDWMTYYSTGTFLKTSFLFPNVVPILLYSPSFPTAEMGLRRMFPKLIKVDDRCPSNELAEKFRDIINEI